MNMKKMLSFVAVLAVPGCSGSDGTSATKGEVADPAVDTRPSEEAPTATAFDASKFSVLTPATDARADEGRRLLAVMKPAAAPDATSCWSGVRIESLANWKFVSTELNWGGSTKGALRVRATSVGSWEVYTVCRDSSDGLTVISSDGNNEYVSAELAYGGNQHAMLRARATVTGPWEYYYTSSAPGGNATTIRSAANNLYVSAELGFTGDNNGLLRARAATVGPWESFAW